MQLQLRPWLSRPLQRHSNQSMHPRSAAADLVPPECDAPALAECGTSGHSLVSFEPAMAQPGCDAVAAAPFHQYRRSRIRFGQFWPSREGKHCSMCCFPARAAQRFLSVC